VEVAEAAFILNRFLDFARNDEEDWIPAFAGMTNGEAGMTNGEAGMTVKKSEKRGKGGRDDKQTPDSRIGG